MCPFVVQELYLRNTYIPHLSIHTVHTHKKTKKQANELTNTTHLSIISGTGRGERKGVLGGKKSSKTKRTISRIKKKTGSFSQDLRRRKDKKLARVKRGT